VCVAAPGVVVCEVLLEGGGGAEDGFGNEDCGCEGDGEEERCAGEEHCGRGNGVEDWGIGKVGERRWLRYVETSPHFRTSVHKSNSHHSYNLFEIYCRLNILVEDACTQPINSHDSPHPRH
jgi:hypothetical protein